MHYFLGVSWLSTSTRIFTWIYWEGGCQSAGLSYIVNKIYAFQFIFQTLLRPLYSSIREYLVLGCFFFIIIDVMFIQSYLFYSMNQSYIFMTLFFFLICKKTIKVKALHKLNEKKWVFFLLKHLLHPQVCIIYQHLHVLNKTIFYTVLRIKGILFNCKNIASFIAVHHLL